MANKKYTAEEVAQALRETKGMTTIAATRLGCDYTTVQRYIKDYPTVAAAKQQAHEQMGDAAELKLYNLAVQDGNPTALIFLLKTQFKQRGYVEKLEIDIRYVAIIQQLETAAKGVGIDLAEALNDFYEELSQTVISQDSGTITTTATADR